MKVLSDIDVSGKRVFVRADLDVPLNDGKRLGDKERDNNHEGLETATRLAGLKPTIDYIRKHGAKQIIIAGKIGRPKGKADPQLSTLRIKDALEKILGVSISFAADIEHQPEGEVVLLENTHFWPEELEPSEEFARKLAKLADVYVNENFASSHRNEASVSLLPRLLPHAAGLRLQKETEELNNVLQNPQRPLVVIIGGAKIETKIPVIERLAVVADYVLIGGYLPIEITKQRFVFPPNVVVATLTNDEKDISSESINVFKGKLANAGTVVLNGPMGKYEDGYGDGTKEVAKAIVASGAYSIVGGGNTEDFLQEAGLLEKFSFVSAGGGAMLAFLAGKELPGLAALE